MEIKTEGGDTFIITIARNWQRNLELWVKKKHKQFASVVAHHLPAWLCKQHKLLVLPLFPSETQKIAKETTWEGNTPFQQIDKETQEMLDTDVD